MAKLSKENLETISNHLIELSRDSIKERYSGYAMYSDEAANYLGVPEQDILDSAEEIVQSVIDTLEFSCVYTIDSDNVGCFETA